MRATSFYIPDNLCHLVAEGELAGRFGVPGLGLFADLSAVIFIEESVCGPGFVTEVRFVLVVADIVRFGASLAVVFLKPSKDHLAVDSVVELSVLELHGATEAELQIVGLEVRVLFEDEVNGEGHLGVVHRFADIEELKGFSEEIDDDGTGSCLTESLAYDG